MLRERLQRAGYLADEDLATTVWLASALQRPLLLEGDAGVGKTALATALAQSQGATLVRLQCFEGLDLAQAAYEWNYGRQLMAIRMSEAAQNGGSHDGAGRVRESDVFSRDYLLERPLLRAISQSGPCVLLIDEIDRADEAFEAFLLEVLAEYQITVPEIGTIRAAQPPIVILTSNRTREIHDALKRRCLYHWVDYPDADRELAIVRARAPQAPEALTKQIVGFVQALRGLDLFKVPGVAEALDWASALVEMDAVALDPRVVHDTLGVLLKYQDDIQKMQGSEIQKILDSLK